MTNPNSTIAPKLVDGNTRGGLTKREYFALKILQSFSVNNDVYNSGGEWYAEKAVKIADSLIHHLNKENVE